MPLGAIEFVDCRTRLTVRFRQYARRTLADDELRRLRFAGVLQKLGDHPQDPAAGDDLQIVGGLDPLVGELAEEDKPRDQADYDDDRQREHELQPGKGLLARPLRWLGQDDPRGVLTRPHESQLIDQLDMGLAHLLEVVLLLFHLLETGHVRRERLQQHGLCLILLLQILQGITTALEPVANLPELCLKTGAHDLLELHVILDLQRAELIFFLPDAPVVRITVLPAKLPQERLALEHGQLLGLDRRMPHGQQAVLVRWLHRSIELRRHLLIRGLPVAQIRVYLRDPLDHLFHCQRELVGARVIQGSNSLFANERVDLLGQVVELAVGLDQLRVEQLEICIVLPSVNPLSAGDVLPGNRVQHDRHIARHPRGPPQAEQVASPDQPRGDILLKLIHRFVDQRNSVVGDEILHEPACGPDIRFLDGRFQYSATDHECALCSCDSEHQVILRDVAGGNIS